MQVTNAGFFDFLQSDLLIFPSKYVYNGKDTGRHKMRVRNNNWLQFMDLRQLNKSIDELKTLVSRISNEPFGLCRSETWLRDDAPPEVFRISNYHEILSFPNVSRNGRVAFYVHSDVSHQRTEISQSLTATLFKHETTKKQKFSVSTTHLVRIKIFSL